MVFWLTKAGFRGSVLPALVKITNQKWECRDYSVIILYFPVTKGGSLGRGFLFLRAHCKHNPRSSGESFWTGERFILFLLRPGMAGIARFALKEVWLSSLQMSKLIFVNTISFLEPLFWCTRLVLLVSKILCLSNNWLIDVFQFFPPS